MKLAIDSYWPKISEINNCIKAEAETAHESLILAVHQSTPLAIRSTTEGDRTETVATEEELLAAFLTPHIPTGTLLLPITGQSGVGKSHMIRWLYAQLKRTDGYKKKSLHIIRIPKSASLKKVVQLILDPLHGEQYDRLRQSLQRAATEITSNVAGIQLRYGLELALNQYKTKIYQEIKDSISPEEKRNLQVSYGHAEKIPSLLTDASLRDYYEGMLANVIMRAIEGKKDDDGEQIPRFTEDNLLVPDHNAILSASKAVISYYNTRIQEPSERQKATDVLNEVLDNAIGYAFNLEQNLGGKTLQDIFLDIREQLFRENKELILLIEDFAALAGIQDPLLKICIQEAVRDGEQVICRMRTAVAVTDGDWSGRDTVLTRVQKEWRVKSKLSSDEDVMYMTELLVGSYLNAARLGDSSLRKLFSSAKGNNDTDLFSWVPKYGEDELTDEKRELLEAFGKSEKGHWLFPFNRQAIGELAEKHLREGGELVFNPRKIINNVLRNVLLMRDIFEKGEFPVANFEGQSASMFIADRVGKTSLPEVDKSRYKSLLRFWAGNPQSEQDLSIFPNEIPKAFGFQPLPGMTSSGLSPSQVKLQPHVQSPQPIQPKIQLPKPQLSTPEDATVIKWKKIVEDWANGVPIAQEDANNLRNLLADALKNYINWNAHFLAPPSRISDDLYFRIHQARGENSQKKPEILVADNNRDEDGSLRHSFLAVIRYRSNGTWDYAGGEDDCLYFSNIMESLSRQVIDWYRAYADKQIAIFGNLLVWSNIVLGGSSPISEFTPMNIMTAIWQRVENKPEATLQLDWDDCRKSCNLMQKALLEEMNSLCAAFQGSGKSPYAIDTTRVAAILTPELLTGEISLDSVNTLKGHINYTEVRDLAQMGRSQSMKGRLKQTIEKIRSLQQKCAALLSPADDLQKISKELCSLIKDAHGDGSSWPARVDSAEELTRKAQSLQTVDIKGLTKLLNNILLEYDQGEYINVAYLLNFIKKDNFYEIFSALESIDVFLTALDAKLDELIRLSIQHDPLPVIQHIKSSFLALEKSIQQLPGGSNVTH